MESVSPNMYVKDILTTIAFYERLGFTVIARVPEAGKLIFAMMTCGAVTCMFQTFDSIAGTLPTVSRNDGGSLLLYIKMKGVRSFYDRIKDEVQVLNGLKKTFYGATEFSIRDPNNFMLTFAEDE